MCKSPLPDYQIPAAIRTRPSQFFRFRPCFRQILHCQIECRFERIIEFADNCLPVLSPPSATLSRSPSKNEVNPTSTTDGKFFTNDHWQTLPISVGYNLFCLSYNITAALNGWKDGCISRRAANPLVFQSLHQSRFRKPWQGVVWSAAPGSSDTFLLLPFKQNHPEISCFHFIGFYILILTFLINSQKTLKLEFWSGWTEQIIINRIPLRYQSSSYHRQHLPSARPEIAARSIDTNRSWSLPRYSFTLSGTPFDVRRRDCLMRFLCTFALVPILRRSFRGISSSKTILDEFPASFWAISEI